MKPSSADFLGLVADLNMRRIVQVMGARAAKQGGLLTMTTMRTNKLKTCRRLHHRFTKGDYRHTDREAGDVLDTCRFLAAEWAEIKGHPARPLELEAPDAYWSQRQLPKGSYEQIAQHLANA